MRALSICAASQQTGECEGGGWELVRLLSTAQKLTQRRSQGQLCGDVHGLLLHEPAESEARRYQGGGGTQLCGLVDGEYQNGTRLLPLPVGRLTDLLHCSTHQNTTPSLPTGNATYTRGVSSDKKEYGGFLHGPVASFVVMVSVQRSQNHICTWLHETSSRWTTMHLLLGGLRHELCFHRHGQRHNFSAGHLGLQRPAHVRPWHGLCVLLQRALGAASRAFRALPLERCPVRHETCWLLGCIDFHFKILSGRSVQLGGIYRSV